MKKVSASLSVELFVECPYCGDILNLFDYADDEDKLYLFENALSEKINIGEKECLDFDVVCDECGQDFKVNEINCED